MRYLAFPRTFGLVAVTSVALTSATAQPSADVSTDLEFVGSTPCDALPRRFVAVPAGAACERISWTLTLSPQSAGGEGTYTLTAVYGMQQINDPGFVGGGTTRRLHGKWTILKGAPAAADASVYRLVADAPRRTIDFVRLSENLLHPADENRTLMVGNPSWSYTLSRRTRVPEAVALKGTVHSVAGAASGVFEGRTACQDLSRVLKRSPTPECTKMKWRLTLTGNTYKLEGSAYRNPPRTGTWSIRRSASDPERVVYDLDARQDGAFLSLLKVDDNLLLFLDGQGHPLVGDAYYSYTLNRVK